MAVTSSRAIVASPGVPADRKTELSIGTAVGSMPARQQLYAMRQMLS
jgi:hypothetical protein